MTPYSRRLERQLSHENRRKAGGLMAGTLRWRRATRQWLGPIVFRLWAGVCVLFVIGILGGTLMGPEGEFLKTNAALLGMAWMTFRGFSLGVAFLSEAKFSARTRTLMALPASEASVITATLGKLRWQPLLILLEFTALISLGVAFRSMEKTFPGLPAVTWLGGIVCASFATLGVANWTVMIASFRQWKIPGDILFMTRRYRIMLFWVFVVLAILGRIVAAPLAESIEGLCSQLHWIPLLGWTVRWFDPVPGQPDSAVFLASTVTVAVLPWLFAHLGLKKGVAFLNRHATALLACHWSSAEIAPAVSRSERSPIASKESLAQQLTPTSDTAPEFRFRFVERFVCQWLTDDERSAMRIHLGHSIPAWTRRALMGSLALLAAVPISLAAKASPSSELSALLTGLIVVLCLFGVFFMLGGATPAKGLNLISLGSFVAPRFAGWPIRVSDLIMADWKITVIRSVTALPVSAGVAFWMGWHFGEGNQAGTRWALWAIAALIILTVFRPSTFIRTLTNATQRPGIFSAVFWIRAAIEIPLVLIMLSQMVCVFIFLSLNKPGFLFAGILVAASMVLPALGMVWMFRTLYDRARISLETIESDKATI